MSNLDFAYPAFFYALILLPVMIGWYIWRGRKSTSSMILSGFENLDERVGSSRIWLRHLLFVFRLVVVGLIIIVLARPQSSNKWEQVTTEGIDVVMCMDVSGSMRAMDFKPNRLEASKNVGIEFVNARQNDRFGLVVFAGESFTQCPMTTDRAVVINFMKDIDFGVIEDGTAIGMGLATAVNRVKESRAKSKVIILLTDGDDNASEVAPLQAAAGAAGEDIKVFPILVGKGGMVLYPAGKNVFGQVQYRKGEVRTNPELLKDIAKTADGKFYRAVDSEALEKDFQDILDHMEKTRLMDPGKFTRHTEVFQLALLPALLSVLLSLAVGWTRFRRFP